MSIQPSVLIWTVICFCVFAYVLNTFLFKPVLKVMDKRRERINKAEECARKRAEDKEAAARQRQEAFESAKALHAKTTAENIARFGENSQAELEAVKRENEKKLEDKRNELLSAAPENKEIIEGEMDKLIAAFTQRLTSYR